MQLVSSAISCRYMWVGVASHLLTHRILLPVPHSLSFSVKLDGRSCVHLHQTCAWAAWVCACVACGVGMREFYVFYFLLFLSFMNINTIK
jgi:hypothetical protein